MAILPTAQDITRQLPQQTSAVVQRNTDPTGAAIVHLGETIARGGEMLAEAVDREALRIDTARVEKAAYELSAKVDDLRQGEKGYAHVKGDYIVSTPKGEKPFIDRYMEQFEAESNRILESLDTPRQKEMMQRILLREKASFHAGLLQHSAVESERHIQATRAGTIEYNTQRAITNVENPTVVQDSLNAINEVHARAMVVDGTNPETTEANRLKDVSAFHTSVIDAMLAKGLVDEAEKYFNDANAKKEILDPSVQKRINTFATSKHAEDAAWAAFDSRYPETSNVIPSRDEGIRALRAWKPDATLLERERFLAAWDERTARRRDDFALRDGEVYLHLVQGEDPNKVIKSPAFMRLDAKTQAKVLESIKKPESNQSYIKLAKLDALLSNPRVLANMSRPEVIAYAQRNALGVGAANRLLEALDNMNKPSGLAKAEADNTELRYAFLAAGENIPKDSDERFIRAKMYMREALANAQINLGRELLPQERRAVYNEAMKEIIVRKGFLFDTSKHMYEMTPEDIGAAQALGNLPR